MISFPRRGRHGELEAAAPERNPWKSHAKGFRFGLGAWKPSRIGPLSDVFLASLLKEVFA